MGILQPSNISILMDLFIGKITYRYRTSLFVVEAVIQAGEPKNYRTGSSQNTVLRKTSTKTLLLIQLKNISIDKWILKIQPY